MKGTYTYIISSVLLIISINASQAATFLDLPDPVAACVSAGTCSASLVDSIPGSDGINPTAMYQKLDYVSGTPSMLVGYSLFNAYDSHNGLTDLNGYLWLESELSYDLSSNSHNFTLYFDKVTPQPDASGIPIQTTNLILDSDALLSGSGSFSVSDYEFITGNMSIVEGLYLGEGIMSGRICLASGCDADVFFNLLYLDYIDMGGGTAVLIPDLLPDARQSVFGSTEYYIDELISEQNFSVQPVPVPAAIWLFISGLAGLGFIRKKTG